MNAYLKKLQQWILYEVIARISYGYWIGLRERSKDEWGEQLCYCGHTDKCTCSNPDRQLFRESVRSGTILFWDKNNGWKRNISETPERWVIVKLPNNYYKVFGTWSGSYLDGDRWRLNSGIEKVEQDEDYYYFIGFSGSCYKCHKGGYGTATSYGLSVLNEIIGRGHGQIELMEDCDDWSNVY